MSNRKQDIVQTLKTSADKTVSLFEGLTDKQLDLQIYRDGAQWTARQVLAHLITIEKTMAILFENILQGKSESSKEFDIERFNRSQPKKLAGLSMAETIALFRKTRSRTIAMVEKMKDEDLDCQGWHPFHGYGRLERFIRWAYEHAEVHEADIRKVLRTD